MAEGKSEFVQDELVAEHARKAEVEIEEIRERLDAALKYAASHGVSLKEAAEAVNEALTILRQGGSDYS